MNNGPKISIITACFNAEKTIEQTILSVLNQTYTNIEYIIIDGASTDNTMNIVRKYENQIDIIVSEQDEGIYDAFNKGARLATGNYVQYLNADDYLDSNHVIEKMSKFISDNEYPVLAYGGIIMVDEVTGYKIIKNRLISHSDIKNGYTVQHPASFVKRECLYEVGLFDKQYRIAADFDVFCKLFNKYEGLISYFPCIITNFRLGGLSSEFKNKERVKQEVQAILTYHYDTKISYTLETSNESYLKKWIEKKAFENKSIATILRDCKISKVAIWGTGELAILIYKELINHGINVLFYIDKNEAKQSIKLNDISVISPEVVIERSGEIECIIMGFEGRHEDSVRQQLSRYDLNPNIAVFSWRELVEEI